uniref:Uncharacterized protein n=1 Tax=Cucumis melo TaxID=3656 RepID=A0A9I9D3M8_CUCME
MGNREPVQSTDNGGEETKMGTGGREHRTTIDLWRSMMENDGSQENEETT